MEEKAYTPDELSELMKDQMILNAIQRPWGWEWKFLTAYEMIQHGRDIRFVKKMLGLTSPQLRRWGMLDAN